MPAANKIYPLKGTRLCPPQTQQDVNTQINQIQAKQGAAPRKVETGFPSGVATNKKAAE